MGTGREAEHRSSLAQLRVVEAARAASATRAFSSPGKQVEQAQATATHRRGTGRLFQQRLHFGRGLLGRRNIRVLERGANLGGGFFELGLLRGIRGLRNRTTGSRAWIAWLCVKAFASGADQAVQHMLQMIFHDGEITVARRHTRMRGSGTGGLRAISQRGGWHESAEGSERTHCSNVSVESDGLHVPVLQFVERAHMLTHVRVQGRTSRQHDRAIPIDAASRRMALRPAYFSLKTYN